MVAIATALILSLPIYLSSAGHAGPPAHALKRGHHHTAKCGHVNAEYVPSCGSWFGTTGAPTLAAGEAIAGRKADIFHEYKSFSSYAGSSSFPGRSAQAAIDSHHMYLFDWKPIADGKVIPWREVASGAMDASYVDVLARKIVSWSAAHHHEKVFMAFHAEPEDEIGKFGTPADYVAAWRHIDARFRALGARSSVIFVWNMTGYMTRVPLWNALYPGDRVVDWLAWDPYGKTPDNPVAAPVVPFPTALGQDRGPRPDTTGAYRFYKWADGPGATAYRGGHVYRKPGSHRKPLMVAEFSVCWASSTLKQAQQWYGRARTFLGKGRYPRVKAFVYFDVAACEKPTGTARMAANFRRAVSVKRLEQKRPY
ncbi:MAG TPA: hypothetical protein VJ716_04835 [Gaiellaceae bacterium]|nr:hypothetical protein [Gaiellaceae bacterium]